MTMHYFKWFFLILLILISQVRISIAEDDANREVKSIYGNYHVPNTESQIKIDGVLDEFAWENALKIDLKYEVEPGENISASVHTECLIIQDDSQLYAAFRAYDPEPESMHAYYKDRDTGLNDDWVGIILDTFNDEYRAFDFRVTPLGVQMDGIMIDNKTDFTMDAIWNSTGKIFDWGYIVEIAIPFNAICFQYSENTQIWGFDAVRNYPRNHKYLFGAFPRDRNNNSYLSQTFIYTISCFL